MGGLAGIVFALLASHQRAKNAHAETLRLIFAQAGQIWIGPVPTLGTTLEIEAPLPELRKMQRYLGLIWLSNSHAKHALIWPDSISAEEHRQLRVWLGIHARS